MPASPSATAQEDSSTSTETETTPSKNDKPFRPIIFTEFNWTYGPSDPPHLIVGNEYLALARHLGVPFISTILDCDEDENRRRIVRRKDDVSVRGTTKLTDADLLKGMRDRLIIYEFGADADGEVRVDVTRGTADDAADIIWESVQGLRGQDERARGRDA